MNRLVLIYLFLFGAVCLQASQEINLQMQVRVFDRKTAVTGLKLKDFKLTVNNEAREILGISSHNVSMSQVPDFLHRHFILSFHTTDYGRDVQQSVSYLISDIIAPADNLILVTPLKIYRIKNSGNKEGIIRDIGNLLRQDCTAYKKDLETAEKNLDNEILPIKRLFGGSIDDDYTVTSYKMVGMFLSTFPRNFLNFRNRFLIPHLNKYKQVMSLLGTKEGQRWWVHFQQAEAYGVMARIREVTAKMERYLSSHTLARQSFFSNLKQLKKMMQLNTAFPAAQILDTFLGANTRFNSILVDNRKEKTASGETHELEAIFNRISRDTGGKSVHTVNPGKGMQEIASHEDSFYRLTYRFNGTTENKSFRISVSGKKLKPVYAAELKKEELQDRLNSINGRKVTIEDVSLEQRRLKFSITSFDRYMGESFGLVKIRVELLTGRGSPVFHSQKVLRIPVNRETVSVSFPVPRKFRGKFILRIHAWDMIANRLQRFRKEVRLR